jgi:carbamoyl-phosphate synthase / aspartate carbamoyltransferase
MIELAVLAMMNIGIVGKRNGSKTHQLALKNSLAVESSLYNDGIVAVKVPQVSFGRLAGADPVLGVEMASTGEVACFGRDKFEGYLKALLSTGFCLPRKNILLSIGLYREKVEFLPFIKMLSEMGYTLYATAGTADFASEHGIAINYLDDDTAADLDESQASFKLKSEYLLHHALETNKIDLYINLPSKNKYRQHASFLSRGYLSRRRAVDLSVPFITNVKCAKLFVEALLRYGSDDIPIRRYDSHSEYVRLNYPGWIVISKRLENMVESHAVPNTQQQQHQKQLLNSKRSTKTCLENGIVAIVDVDIIMIPKDADLNMKPLSADLKREGKRLFATNARGNALAAIIFACTLHGHSIHVLNIHPDDIEIITLAKSKGLQVTCDIDVSILLMQCESNFNAKSVPSSVDILNTSAGKEEGALTMLMKVANTFDLSMEFLIEKTHGNPQKIFGIQKLPKTIFR